MKSNLDRLQALDHIADTAAMLTGLAGVILADIGADIGADT